MKTIAIFKQVSAMLMAMLLVANVYAISDKKKAEIADRIKPVGEVCIEGDTSCASASAAAAGGEPRSGKEVYDASCNACHGTGAAGAPKLGDKAGWASRIAAGKLYDNAIKGVGGMPAMGLCMTCSEDEVKASR